MDDRQSASASRASAPTLVVRDLQCRRGERVLFAPASFTVASGSIVWIRGANGRGKTTLLRTLAGLSAPEAGAIAWSDAAPSSGDAPDTSARPLYLAHANALKDDLTVAESLRFLLLLDGAAAAGGDVDAALGRFGMLARRDAWVRTLSQGQRRRVALARLAVERAPRTWLLDEPFDALDAAAIDVLAAVIVEHARRGGSVVLTSHQQLPIDDPAPIAVDLREPIAA